MRQGRCRAIASAIAVAIALMGGARPCRADRTPEVETLWRGIRQGDSVFVRAIRVWRDGEARCNASELELEDTTGVSPEYLGWWIETRGSTRGAIHGVEFIGCTDAIDVRATEAPAGLWLKLRALGWGCEPAGDCEHFDYAHVGPGWLVQSHGWTHVDWDPGSEALVDGEFDAGCLEFHLPGRMRAVAAEEKVVFEPAVPESASAGWVVLAEIGERSYCPRDTSGSIARTIRGYRTAAGVEFDRVVVEPREPIDMVRAAVRLERGAAGAWVPRLFRVEAISKRWRGFVTLAELDSIGFHYLR